MTTVQITLPDDLARQAHAAKLFTPDTITGILRDHLRRQAAQALRQLRASLPQEELTPAIEREIDEAVHADRAARRPQGSQH